jgi:hypothetical protein
LDKFNFKFYLRDNFISFYNYDLYAEDDDSVYFSNFFLSSHLQVNDYGFLHRDFYYFYPVFKYMFLYDLLFKEMSLEDLNFIRNCIALNDRTFDLRDAEEARSTVKRKKKHFGKYSGEDLDIFLVNKNSTFLRRDTISKFFHCFLDEEIYDFANVESVNF